MKIIMNISKTDHPLNHSPQQSSSFHYM